MDKINFTFFFFSIGQTDFNLFKIIVAICEAWWHTSAIPAVQKLEVGGSGFQGQPQAKSMRPYMQNKLKQKSWGHGSVLSE
jgi:hypothetical protein